MATDSYDPSEYSRGMNYVLKRSLSLLPNETENRLRHFWNTPRIVRLRRPSPRNLRRGLKPISISHGFDRGTPIDRKLISNFLELNSKIIDQFNHLDRRILEVGDSVYRDKYFPKSLVTVLLPPMGLYENDFRSPENPYYFDLNEKFQVKMPNTPKFDFIIATQVLNFLENAPNGVDNLLGLLNKEGILLLTVASSHPVSVYDADRWGDFIRIMPQYFDRILENLKYEVEIISYEIFGNCALTVARYVGLSAEEMSSKVWKENDSAYPVVICALLKKR